MGSRTPSGSCSQTGPVAEAGNDASSVSSSDSSADRFRGLSTGIVRRPGNKSLSGFGPQDIPQIARLFTDTVRVINSADYSPEQVATWAPDPPDLDYWRQRLGVLTVFVSRDDSGITGFATFSRDGILDHLYVHKDRQRLGIATELCRRVEDEARKQGFRRMETAASITARPFFERAGYQLIDRQSVQFKGVEFTNFWMVKALPERLPRSDGIGS